MVTAQGIVLLDCLGTSDFSTSFKPVSKVTLNSYARHTEVAREIGLSKDAWRKDKDLKEEFSLMFGLHLYNPTLYKGKDEMCMQTG